MTATSTAPISDLSQAPPYNLDAERAVLGSILIDNAVLPQVAEVLKISQFYRAIHQILYHTILQLAAEDKPIDYMGIHDRLRDDDEYKNAGGLTYLTTLEQYVMTTANAVHYATIVKDAADRRFELHQIQRLLAAIEAGDHDAAKAHRATLQAFYESLADGAERPAAESKMPKREVITIFDYFDLEDQYPEPDSLWGDGIICRTQTHLIAAQWKIGKSMFCAQLAAHVAMGLDFLGFQTKRAKIVYIQVEIADKQMIRRLKGSPNHRGMFEFLTNGISPDQYEALRENLYIMASPMGFTLYCSSRDEMDRNWRWLHQRLDRVQPDLIIIDPFYKVFRIDDVKADLVAESFGIVDRIVRNHGSGVFIVHHFNKEQAGRKQGGADPEKSARGHGSLLADPSTIINLYWPDGRPKNDRSHCEINFQLRNRPEIDNFKLRRPTADFPYFERDDNWEPKSGKQATDQNGKTNNLPKQGRPSAATPEQVADLLSVIGPKIHTELVFRVMYKFSCGKTAAKDCIAIAKMSGKIILSDRLYQLPKVSDDPNTPDPIQETMPL